MKIKPTYSENELPTARELIGQLIRNGRPIFYAYIDGRKVERLTYCGMYASLWQAWKDQKPIGATNTIYALKRHDQ